MLFCFSMSLFLVAQEPEKQKEIGLVFSSFNNFGITYKTGTAKSLWRFSTLSISGDNMNQTQDSTIRKQNNFGFGIRAGKEYRKEIAKNLELRYGADLAFSFSQSKSNYDELSVRDHNGEDKESFYSPGFNLVLGLNYELNENLVFGVEILPYFAYSSTTSTSENNYDNYPLELKTEISRFRYGLSNNSVLLTLAYRF